MSFRANNSKIDIFLRRIVLVLVVLSLMWDSMIQGSILMKSIASTEFALFVAAVVILTLPRKRIPDTWRGCISLLIVIFTVVLSVTVQHNTLGTSLLCFVAWIAGARLSEPWAWWTGAVTVVGFILLLIVIKPFGPHLSMAYVWNTVGLLGLFVGARYVGLLRIAREAREQYLLDLERAHRELQEVSLQSMQAAVLQERNRIARDIHDSVGHELTTLVVQLQALQLRIQKDVESAEQKIAELLVVARRSLHEVRHSVRNIASSAPITGLQALTALVNSVRVSSGLAIAFDPPTNVDDWPLDTGVVLYRLLQEALTNIVRHSGAKNVSIRLERTDRPEEQAMRLLVEDDGKALPTVPVQEGFGIRGMRARCQECGGTFTWQAVAPHGLRLKAIIPLYKSKDEDVSRHVNG